MAIVNNLFYNQSEVYNATLLIEYFDYLSTIPSFIYSAFSYSQKLNQPS